MERELFSVYCFAFWFIIRTVCFFSKLMRPLVKLLRAKGLKAVMYLYAYAVKGRVEAERASAYMGEGYLGCAGLVVNRLTPEIFLFS